MKNLLLTICEESGYITPKNLSGITLEMIIDASLYGNIVEYIREATGCAKQTVTNALSKAFPDRDPIHDSSIPKFLLKKWGLRLCAACSEIKEISDFYTNAGKGDGIATSCKDCSKLARINTYKKDPAKEITKNNERKADIRLRTPAWADIDVIEEFYRNTPAGYHVDHIIPLHGKLVSGLHIISNLQYLTKEENLSKSNRFEIS